MAIGLTISQPVCIVLTCMDLLCIKFFKDQHATFPSKGDRCMLLCEIVRFQKISIPPPRRELEIPEGWGGQWPRKFQRGGGVNGWISFQRVNFTFMSDIVVQNCNLPTSQLRRSFLKTLLCLTVLKKPLLH